MSENQTIVIKRARTARALSRFLEFPYELHREDSLWVPPLRKEQATLLNRKKHPFHNHAMVEYFVAFRDGEIVGRIAAIENQAHNIHHKTRDAHFGFLNAQPEEEVFTALLHAVEKWAASKGLKRVLGPCSFSTNEECGLLVDGFQSPPFLMTPWNPESYPALIEKAGYTKARDLISYWLSVHSYNKRMERIASKVVDRFARKGETIRIRNIDMNHFDEELELVREVYNSAWNENWGFVPMTDDEITFMAKELKSVIVPELVHFVEINGEVAGFSMSLPDYNLILRHMDGKLGAKEIALFYGLKKKIHQIRVMAMGVKNVYRNRGLETLLVSETVKGGTTSGYTVAELGWILEDNTMMNRELIAIGSTPYKTHRIYEKWLTAK